MRNLLNMKNDFIKSDYKLIEKHVNDYKNSLLNECSGVI